MPPPTPDLFGIFFLGAVTGSTLCTVSCLGYLGPLLVGQGRGLQGGLASGLLFASGKILCYGLLGALAAMGGSQLGLTPRHAAWLMAASFLFMAATLLRPQKKCTSGCTHTMGRWSFFGLGVITGMLPCPALMGLLAMAAASSTVPGGAVYGLVFGLGLLFSPLIPIAAGLGHIGARLKQEISTLAPAIRLLCALMLAAAGLRVLLAA